MASQMVFRISCLTSDGILKRFWSEAGREWVGTYRESSQYETQEAAERHVFLAACTRQHEMGGLAFPRDVKIEQTLRA